MAHKLKIYSDDARVNSFDIYANGVYKTNVSIAHSVTIKIIGQGDVGDCYYILNDGEDTEIPSQNYGYPNNKTEADAIALTLSNVSKLEVYASGQNLSTYTIYDDNFNVVTGASCYSDPVDITQYLQDGYYVIVYSDE